MDSEYFAPETGAIAPAGTSHEATLRAVQSVIDALSTQVCVVDAGGQVRLVNRAWRRVAASRGDLAHRLGSDYREACRQVHGPGARDARRVAAALDALLAGAQDSLDVRYTCDLGEPHTWYNVHGVAIDMDGERWVMLVHEDAIPEVAGDAELREGLRKYSSLVQRIRDGIFVAQDHHFVFTNPALDQMLGYAPGELAGAPFEQLIAPEHYSLWRARFDARIAGLGPLESYEVNLLHRDGRRVPVELRATLSDYRGRAAVLGIMVDIGERRRVEQQREQTLRALAESERGKGELLERLNEAQRTAHIGSWTYEFASDELWWSDELYRIFGVEPATFRPTRDCTRLFANADDWNVYQDAVRRARLEGRELDHELRINVRDEVRTCRSRGHLTYGEDGAPRRFSGTFQDITETKRLEHERARLQVQLMQAQKMEAIGQLTGGIAHDFNNILGGIVGYTTLALERQVPPGPSKLRDYLNEVLTAGLRARDLVAKMLSFSRSQPVQDVPEALAADRVVEDSMRVLSSTIPATTMLSLDADPGLPPVYVDPVELQQVLMNLVINARDAIDGGGTIRVGLRRVDVAHRVCDGCHGDAAGSFVELSVSDSGAGIAPEHRVSLFEPFFSTKPADRGTGLGLSVVHGVLHRVGGHVLVESRPGGGTVMRVLFRHAEAGTCERSVAAAGDAAPREVASGRRHGFAVDDVART